MMKTILLSLSEITVVTFILCFILFFAISLIEGDDKNEATRSGLKGGGIMTITVLVITTIMVIIRIVFHSFD